MNNTYTWTIKKLNEDYRGYANSMYLEMSGSDNKNNTTASIAIAFSSEDYKPFSAWLEEDIDNYSAQHYDTLKDSIDERLVMILEESNE